VYETVYADRAPTLEYERTIAGYKAGEVRDSVYKIHPHIRPYCELSKEVLMNDQRVIDALPKLVQMEGYEIERS
jgi:hypothetical protein